MELIYKTLCEIKLEHEYFLTKEDGTNLFGESDPLKRHEALEQAFESDRESMNRDIYFDFPNGLRERYNEYGLKLSESYSGCKVLIRVSKKILPDNSLVFEPFFSLPTTLDIFILLIKKNNLPDFYSNERIERSVPANYLFSNENIPNSKEYPFLVNAVSAFDSGVSYEHGELALDVASKLQEYFYDNSGNLQQREVNTVVKNFANENDRLLVPASFNYAVTGNITVTQLDITLKDKSSAVIKSFSFNQIEPLRKVQLSFSDKARELGLTDIPSLPDEIFSLEALGNNGYTDKKNIVFGDILYSIFNWGITQLKTRVTNALYNLITDEGWIIQRRDPFGVWSNAPVFEIPVKSRSANFRYLNNNGKELIITNPVLNNFLRKENKALISQEPVSLCRYYFLVSDSGGITKRYLPNPRIYDIKKDDFKRIYFDIMVSESDLFPVLP
jgi:hypothetical protein